MDNSIKHVVLCADDYGQNAAISQAIIKLFQKKRLTATSCITNFPCFKEQAGWLKPFAKEVDLGLHFNLTDGRPLSNQFRKSYGNRLPPLPRLIVDAYLRHIDARIIATELSAQFDAFVDTVGRLPDFMDGHQHVHQLPVVRDIFLAMYEARLKNTGAYLRSVLQKPWQRPLVTKGFLIQVLGANSFEKQLVNRNIPHNTSFSGIYQFGSKYAQLFPQFLAAITEKGIIMCHPGLATGSDKDQIGYARAKEYDYLSGDQYLKDCASQGVVFTRYSK
ncbi:hypothetical protein AYO45_06650 [Gammaproteobacteria bacterium SCGC AG-212-F23]|nr:hypothetical protein AYO45_06650 [Gammaproteobacteria bacterium SCGC AG-212-F23]